LHYVAFFAYSLPVVKIIRRFAASAKAKPMTNAGHNGHSVDVIAGMGLE
jgi:hypothetical protein